MRRKTIIPALLAAAGLAIIGDAGAVWASGHENGDQGDIALLEGAKIGLGQAVISAEQATSGRALHAELVKTDGAAGVAVELVKDGKIQTVVVDAATGKVGPVETGEGENGEHENDEENE